MNFELNNDYAIPFIIQHLKFEIPYSVLKSSQVANGGRHLKASELLAFIKTMTIPICILMIISAKDVNGNRKVSGFDTIVVRLKSRYLKEK